MKRLGTFLIALTMTASMVSCSSKSSSSTNEQDKEFYGRGRTVGIALPAQNLERWNRDGAFLKEQFEAVGCKVDLKYADNDKDKQIEDVQSMIDEGVQLLLIAAVDKDNLSHTLNNAKEAGIPVVAYDRLIMNTDAVTYYVSFDNYMVGTIQGQYIEEKLKFNETDNTYNIEFVGGDELDNNARFFFNGAYDYLSSYINSGKLNIVSGKNTFEQVATEEWSTDNARNNMKQVLADNYSDGKTLDAVICANDSTALGVTEAVQSNYSGSNHPLIVGQDGDVENLKNIVDGSQDMTVFKNVNDEAKVTLEICKLILSNETPSVSLLENLHVDVKYDTSSYNNGVKYIQSYLLAPYAVDKDNLQSLVDTGIYKWDSNNKYLEIAK